MLCWSAGIVGEHNEFMNGDEEDCVSSSKDLEPSVEAYRKSSPGRFSSQLGSAVGFQPPLPAAFLRLVCTAAFIGLQLQRRPGIHTRNRPGANRRDEPLLTVRARRPPTHVNCNYISSFLLLFFGLHLFKTARCHFIYFPE